MGTQAQLDSYVSRGIRTQIEQRFLAPINARARLDRVIHDPQFYQDPKHHVLLYSDHGIVHARDVARQILQVLDIALGLLIPARDPGRLEFMKGYGVLLAYIHDLGMADFTPFGRAMHPEFVTQTVLGPDFDTLFQAIWDENCGNLAWRLTRLAEIGALESAPATVLREMLALANCHSKNKVPAETLCDLQRLREVMQKCAGTDLRRLYHEQQAGKAEHEIGTAMERRTRAAAAIRSGAPAPGPLMERLHQRYADFQRDAFRWLVSSRTETRDLVGDVVDTLRTLRCADALRQRGTVLETSAGYEIFIDRKTANAICALRLGEDELFLLEVSDIVNVGETNIASSQLDRDGNLRISFHRGAFPDAETVRRAAYNTALVVNDIQGDAIESFRRPATAAVDGLKTDRDMEILLEGVDDNLEFAALVRQELAQINPSAAARARCVPSLQNTSPLELDRYLQGASLDWDEATRRAALQRIARSGHKTDQIDPGDGFADVKLVELQAGEVLIEARSPSAFVYIPLDEGLRVAPLSGGSTFLVRPWIPLGVTGVVRGAARNATVTAECGLTALMIPQEVYLRAWHHTYGVVELAQLLARRRDVAGAGP